MAGPFNPCGDGVKFTAVTGDTVAILVGKDEQRFAVHETQLRSQSNSLEASLTRNRIEGTPTIKLPAEVPSRFNIYVQWLYSGLLVGVATDCEPEMSSTAWWQLIKLYTMGSRLQDQDFQDAVTDAIVWISDRVKLVPDEDIAEFIYTNTLDNDPARLLITDFWVECGKAEWFDGKARDRADSMAEFYFDVARVLVAVANQGAPKPAVTASSQNDCKYHHHGDKPCYRTKR